MNGEVSVGEGTLRGIGTIHRAGDMTLKYVPNKDEIIVGGAIGLTDLKVRIFEKLYFLKLYLFKASNLITFFSSSKYVFFYFKGEYTFKLKLGIWKESLTISLKMSYVSIDILTDAFLSQSQMNLESCAIKDLR